MTQRNDWREKFPKRAKLLDFICTKSSIPSLDEIATHMGWKAQSTARDAIMNLAADGVLEPFDRIPYGRNGRYMWRLTKMGKKLGNVHGKKQRH